MKNVDYSILDRPEALAVIFHPRPETNLAKTSANTADHLISVDADVHVGARFHLASPTGSNLLFFHGNGEIVSDYNDLGPLYNNLNINFMAVDYRGYGRSSGRPTVRGMMEDSHTIMAYVKGWLKENGYAGPFIIMGRSLGSASALELATTHANQIDGLIIESGFAFTAPLLRLLGMDPKRLGFEEDQGFQNLDKIKGYKGPTLIIHAEYDHIIPFSDGRTLYEASPSKNKALLKIDNANHNDIFFRGLKPYMQAVQSFMQSIQSL